MSRSQPNTRQTNPATRFFEWKGSDGGRLLWYDKEAKENKEVKLPFAFLVLDQLNVVSGYSKKAKSGIYSNEVRDVQKDPMEVKLFDGTQIATGLWSEIKEKVAYNKGSFAKSCYIAFKDGADLKIGNIKFTGCSLGPWFDFTKEHSGDIDSKAVTISRGELDDSGDVKFTPPKFAVMDTSEETNAKAVELDKHLQEYLGGYLKSTRKTEVDGDDSLPGEEPPTDSQEEPQGNGGIGTPVDDDDIPFAPNYL